MWHYQISYFMVYRFPTLFSEEIKVCSPWRFSWKVVQYLLKLNKLSNLILLTKWEVLNAFAIVWVYWSKHLHELHATSMKAKQGRNIFMLLIGALHFLLLWLEISSQLEFNKTNVSSKICSRRCYHKLKNYTRKENHSTKRSDCDYIQ